MNVPRNATILACLLLLGGCGRGEGTPSPIVTLDGDLEPLESALTYHTPEYHVRLRRVLRQKAPDDCVLQFLVMPSFEPETLLSLQRVGQGYEAHLLTPREQIWYSKTPVDQIACTEAKKGFPAVTAERLREVWQQMLRRTRYTEAPPTTLDGASYAFLNLERGVGRDWSAGTSNPLPGTRPDLLAQIGEDVIAYVRADANAAPALLAKVDAALAQLAASLAK